MSNTTIHNLRKITTRQEAVTLLEKSLHGCFDSREADQLEIVIDYLLADYCSCLAEIGTSKNNIIKALNQFVQGQLNRMT